MGDTVSSLLFQPPPPTKLKEEKIIWLKTKGGYRIPGFYISYKSSGGVDVSRSLSREELQCSSPEQGITILYSHANAEDLGSIYPWCKFLSKMLRVNLFAYDYAGYGMAYDKGPPAEDNCYSDIEAAYHFLRNMLNIPASNIVLYGRSLGSGPSCHLAAGTKDQIGGLILHAPFLSVYRIVVDTGCTVYGDKFPNIDYAPMIETPTLLIHGTNDQIVPFYHSEKLYEALNKGSRVKPLFIEGMGHNNVHAAVRGMFVMRIVEFLQEHVEPGIDRAKSISMKHSPPLRQRIAVKTLGS
eukprot:CAMPEP_0202452468 /NCGR_PEP_ID=MMETSP1360-20130828/10676_1 /ASSEMBLY_ACC=CAM_ASM_000848 /TAXON_ID=515479 /ORGANISM="Licmophora paradoxa, Strain CCMP2313" /LENGTH=296 /DNA_ID=CAMNT_0049071303 /DNA_START=281 /DNA_END=1171 /DNA_ORIENTATION=+